ncbi:hypothetical protein COU61_00265 [Candidatus Pacearchaeota archaeon CG10_big_fil_rev_8_21_14_0_10_35_13]|nr:MAG: hypothetical protein COU61_00265 [Candidatus Pacearchaeota archaeon CG10_big_fil_rev_8_21_14_0_10_35_13]
MTTLVGMKYDGGIILASDLAMTRSFTEDYGDFTIRRRIIIPTRKIHVSEDGNLALAATGRVGDDPFQDPLHDILKPTDLDMNGRISKGDFPEFRDLHVYKRWDREVADNDNTSILLLASRYKDNQGLYVVSPLGKISPVNGYGIKAKGSGQEHAERFLSGALEAKIQSGAFLSVKHFMDQLTSYEALQLARGAVEAGATDPHTRYWDAVLVDNKGILDVGEFYRQKSAESEENIMEGLKGRLASHEKD